MKNIPEEYIFDNKEYIRRRGNIEKRFENNYNEDEYCRLLKICNFDYIEEYHSNHRFIMVFNRRIPSIIYILLYIKNIIYSIYHIKDFKKLEYFDEIENIYYKKIKELERSRGCFPTYKQYKIEL